MMKDMHVRSRSSLYYVVLDEDTLSKRIVNEEDPNVVSIFDYMAVNNDTHPHQDQRVAILRHAIKFAKRVQRNNPLQNLIDVFVTHAWIDDTKNPGKKMHTLLALNDVFLQKFGRPLTVWYEKFCIPQDGDVMKHVQLLPVYIASCATLLCMYSQDWRSRLWCLPEAADLAAMGGGPSDPEML